MNYLKEINAFIDWLEVNPLEATTQTLWMHIMAIANKSGWPEWFTVANLTLMARVGISENTLNKHRNILIQKGRIDYKSQGKQKAGKYRIIPFISTAKNEVKDEVINDTTSNIEVKHEVKREVTHEVNCEVKPSALYKLNETKLNICSSTTTTNQQEEFTDNEFLELAKLYQQCIGEPNGLTAQWINNLHKEFGFEWFKNAFLIAEKQGKRTKRYIEGILQNWKRGGGMKLENDNKSSFQISNAPIKTRFHNFEQRTSKYTAEEIEELVRKKRELSK